MIDELEKRGKWFSPSTDLKYDPSSWPVTFPSTNGKTMKAAVEDIKHSVSTYSFSRMVQNPSDALYNEIHMFYSLRKQVWKL